MGPPGHLGVGFAAKAAAPAVPVWVFLLASWFLDLLSYLFEALGLESFGTSKTDMVQGVQVLVPASVPWSHGLVMSIFWSAAFGLVAYGVFRDKRASLILAGVVFSHWILDLIVHPPDLPVFLEETPLLGLGLWSSGPGLIASIVLEFVLLIGGVVIYLRWRKGQQQAQLA